MKLRQSANQRQRFVISPELFKAVSTEEVEATYKDMVELKMNRPPYQYFEIEISSENVFAPGITIPKGTQYEDFDELLTEAARREGKLLENKFNVLVKCDCDENYEPTLVSVWVDSADGKFIQFGRPKEGVDVAEVRNKFGLIECKATSMSRFTHNMFKLLIVLLATKNIEKQVKIDKLAKLGIGKNKHKPHTITYLKIGKITETVTKSGKPAPTGTVLMPHLRRGHWRHHQHYGLGNKYEKSVYIWQTIVNADKGWIGDRNEYRVL
jgi:hypothetical protein